MSNVPFTDTGKDPYVLILKNILSISRLLSRRLRLGEHASARENRLARGNATRRFRIRPTRVLVRDDSREHSRTRPVH